MFILWLSKKRIVVRTVFGPKVIVNGNEEEEATAAAEKMLSTTTNP